jgi:hypothetical protein
MLFSMGNVKVPHSFSSEFNYELRSRVIMNSLIQNISIVKRSQEKNQMTRMKNEKSMMIYN